MREARSRPPAEPRISTYAQDAADSVAIEGTAFNRSQVQELWVYKANTANQFPTGTGSFTDCTTCVKFRWNGTRFAPFYSNWNAIDQKACAAGPPDRVGERPAGLGRHIPPACSRPPQHGNQAGPLAARAPS